MIEIESATLLALASLYVSLRVAWDTRFKPAEVVAFFSSFNVLKFIRKDQDSEILLIPILVLTNTGAQAAIIEDIRIGFLPKNTGMRHWVHPSLSVPLRAIEHPGEFVGESSSADDFGRMALGKTFTGFVLTSGGVVSVNYAFSGPKEGRPAIVGVVHVDLQIWLRGARRWKSVASDEFAFDEDPFVPPVKTENKNTTRFIFVYSQSSDQRRK